MLGARSVLPILLLLAGSLSPPALHAQEAKGRFPGQSGQGFSLEQNYPNPVSSDTWIPFYLEDSLFESSDSVVVSLRIFNMLSQAVAIPVAQSQPRGARERLINLVFRQPGRKLAYWDGKDTSGKVVPTGVYYGQLVVDDRLQTRKIVVFRQSRGRSILPRF
jgi:hypothetical protein